MLARVRIEVPDRPGALGRLASAIGVAGGDIAKVDVLESESGRALDDVFVVAHDEAHLERVTTALQGVPGVDVLGVQHPVPPVTGHADLELVEQVLARPERALRTLVDGSPGALGADWAAIVEYGDDGMPGAVVLSSTRCPSPAAVTLRAPLRLASVRMAAPQDGVSYGGTALVPIGELPLGLVLVREGGPDFHTTELWRLGQIGQIIGVAVPAMA
jgi:hypothetical protein